MGFPVTTTRRRPIALMITPVDSPYTPIVSTPIGSNWCASARAAYLRRLRSSALFAAKPASIADLFRCAPAKVSTHVQSQTKLDPTPTKREDCYTIRAGSIYSIQPGRLQNRWQAGFLKRSLNHVIHCRMPWKAASTVFAGQAMQTPILSILPPQRQEWGIQTSAPTLRAMATLKLSGSSSVPSEETGKALSQAPNIIIKYYTRYLYTVCILWTFSVDFNNPDFNCTINL